MPSMDDDWHFLEVEEFRQRQSVLAVGSPVERPVTADVDVDLVADVSEPWTLDAGDLALCSISVFAQRSVEAVDLRTPVVELGERAVPPGVTEPLELVEKRVVESGVSPGDPVVIVFAQAAVDGSVLEPLPPSIPGSADDASPLGGAWDPLEDASGYAVWIDADEGEGISVSVPFRVESALEPVYSTKWTEPKSVGEWCGDVSTELEHELAPETQRPPDGPVWSLPVRIHGDTGPRAHR